jgi:hypothetical protein
MEFTCVNDGVVALTVAEGPGDAEAELRGFEGEGEFGEFSAAFSGEFALAGGEERGRDVALLRGFSGNCDASIGLEGCVRPYTSCSCGQNLGATLSGVGVASVRHIAKIEKAPAVGLRLFFLSIFSE